MNMTVIDSNGPPSVVPLIPRPGTQSVLIKGGSYVWSHGEGAFERILDLFSELLEVRWCSTKLLGVGQVLHTSFHYPAFNMVIDNLHVCLTE